MKKIIITLVLFFMTTTAVQAAELIMFSMASCGYCQRFLKEVAPTYAESESAKLLPLRIISMDTRSAPKWFDKAIDAKKIDNIAGTPTFVVFDSGEEKARLLGYTSKKSFYEDIKKFIESNRGHLEKSAGLNTIPYEKETELNYKQALIQENKKVMDDKKVMPDEGKLLPNGVVNSHDIFDHTYKTRQEAEIAALWLGCSGIHTHEAPNGDELIWMPCEMRTE